jgi:hypothetical protein
MELTIIEPRSCHSLKISKSSSATVWRAGIVEFVDDLQFDGGELVFRPSPFSFGTNAG